MFSCLWIVSLASESCWTMWGWALLFCKFTSSESLPDLLDWIVGFSLSCNILLYQTLYCFSFQLRVNEYRAIRIPKHSHPWLSCRWLGLWISWVLETLYVSSQSVLLSFPVWKYVLLSCYQRLFVLEICCLLYAWVCVLQPVVLVFISHTCLNPVLSSSVRLGDLILVSSSEAV